MGIGIYAGIYYSQPENAPLMASWAIDIYDHEVMVEDSENVFIGTVESVDGNKNVKVLISLVPFIRLKWMKTSKEN